MARMKNSRSPKRKGKFDPVRLKFQKLVDKANKIVSYIRKSGTTTVGYQQAISTLSPKLREAVEKGERELFSLDDRHHFPELRKELDRVGQFLTSDSGTIRAAKYAQEQLEANQRYYGAFRNSNFHPGGHIDERLDRDIAEVAFSIYRRIEEGGADIIYDGGYGSENLVNFIYNSIVESGDYSSDYAIGEAIRKSRAVLDQKRKEMDFNGKVSYKTGNRDTGELKKVAEARRFEDIDW